MKIIDISIPVKEDMPVWPNGAGPRFKRSASDLWVETEITMGLHTGTHIDAPLHRIKSGASIENLKLEIMMGPAFVAYLPEVKEITASDLDGLDLPKNTTRLLFRTLNSKLRQKKFRNDFVGLTPAAALWLIKNKIRLVGIDYLSVAKFDRQPEVHKILLERKIILLEGLNLSGVKQGIYQLICLPMKIVGTEAAPARVILIRCSK